MPWQNMLRKNGDQAPSTKRCVECRDPSAAMRTTSGGKRSAASAMSDTNRARAARLTSSVRAHSMTPCSESRDPLDGSQSSIVSSSDLYNRDSEPSFASPHDRFTPRTVGTGVAMTAICALILARAVLGLAFGAARQEDSKSSGIETLTARLLVD
eukprot:CAMPEP_0178444348 /NCGR_PEP_ID=MMETSP0689_2-20121128/39444_1 /TAXON_ID=160604 /ORGANISM="Amphidinium massartii, Strain CS-259" /LENGTH=154 /DNA_ID=CAMNT_0020068543 /DNA_START=1060 /DNA_END=1522 /DNA_ORIENTATION=-